ncbi:MAG TPA: agmatine deiminase family protein [Rickettsiales bacterium]|nr:agmatine deiminase family protein [Rickettsiales bacterium]
MTFRMPAEWEKQAAVWLAWPHNRNDWPGKFDAIKWAYADIIGYLTRELRVRLVVKNASEQEKARVVLETANVDLGKVDFIIAVTNRSWLRDSAPTFVYEGKKRVLLDWRFNAWAKYDNWRNDDKIPSIVGDFLKLPCVQPMHKGKRVVMEGGALEVNGKGLLLTTEECLLSDIQCRNPGFTREDYEQVFAKYMGISNAIWLGNGIAGDDTHGHIDDLARFVNADTVVTVMEKDKNDPNHTPLKDNAKRLKKAGLNVIELPMPRKIMFEDYRLPASYANFIIANGIVLMPTFNDPNDRVALNILAEAFPKHDVIGIHCGDFILGLGTIHCASQQEIV